MSYRGWFGATAIANKKPSIGDAATILQSKVPGINQVNYLKQFGQKDMGCQSSILASHGVNTRSYGALFKKRAYEGKQTPETVPMVKLLKQNLGMKIEDQLFTEANIGHHRTWITQWIQHHRMAEKEFHDAQAALIDMSSFIVKSTDGADIEVFVYKPKALKDEKNIPAYIYAHGGAGCVTEAEDHHHELIAICNNLNCVVFQPGFRNGPEVKCPQGQQDFKSAVYHVLEHGQKYGVDTKRVCIAGISGGGWIAAGATNLIVKAGDISKIRAVFLHTAMLSNELSNVKKEELAEYECEWGPQDLMMLSVFKLHATDFDNQAMDDQLYPGKVSDELLAQYPPTVMFTSEFDFLRRDNEKFASRLQKVGKLVDICEMPGVMHSYELQNYNSAETKQNLADEKLAFDALMKN